MNEKTKLYIFTKLEMALIFLFTLIIATISFTFGVRLGRSYSFQYADLSPADQQQIELLSGQEEKINELVENQNEINDENVIKMDEINRQLEEKIKAELSANSAQVVAQVPSEVEVLDEAPSASAPEPAPSEPEATENVQGRENKSYLGKHTVQLSSHRSRAEAEAFAEGFKVRGYDPIIHPVELPDRGVWYRVCIGVFDSVSEAKEFVKRERTLFQGQDHTFARFE